MSWTLNEKKIHPPRHASVTTRLRRQSLKVFVRVVPPLQKPSEHEPFQWKEATAPICSYLTKLSQLLHFFHRMPRFILRKRGLSRFASTGGQSPHHLTAVGGLKSLGRFATVSAPPKKLARLGLA